MKCLALISLLVASSISLAGGPLRHGLDPQGSLRTSNLIFAPESTLRKVLGPTLVQDFGKPNGIWYRVPGFRLIRVDAAGSKMTNIMFHFDHLATMPGALREIGLSAAGTSSVMFPGVHSPTATRRNGQTVSHVKGLPVDPKTHKPWVITYDEEGTLDQAKLRAIKPQLQNLSGEPRFALIRSCYKWTSLVTIAAP